MADRIELSAEMIQKLDGLTNRIAGAGEASEELRRELRAHLEDKAAAYLNGEERLGEADVLVLVEKHFGDARRLRSALCDAGMVQRAKALLGESFAWVFFRRAAAVIVAAVIASFVGQVADLLWVALIPAQPRPGDGKFFYSLMILLTPAVQALTLVMLLNQWGSWTASPWYIRNSARRVVMTVAVALAVRWALPSIGYIRVLPFFFSFEADGSQLITMCFLIQLPSLIYSLLWVAWRSDGIPRTWRSVADSVVAALLCAGIGPFVAPFWTLSNIRGRVMFEGHIPPRMPLYVIGLPPNLATLCLAIVVGYFIIMIGRSHRAFHAPPLQPA